jgi:hypothetical protein
MFGNNEGYTVNEVVNLEKKIGSDSVFGSIYLTSMPSLLGTYPIASKVMASSINNESETKMNKWITEKLITKKQSKHFVMMYKSTRCVPHNSKDKNVSEDKNISSKEQLVNYNELCNGDLSSLMKTDDKNDEMLMINIAYQVLIAIATYQNRVGYCHRDCHNGNFLYQLNTEGIDGTSEAGSGAGSGYYHYVYNGLDFYIKSCKYNMCIFDFGMSEPVGKTPVKYIFEDYSRILSCFLTSQTTKGRINADMNVSVIASMLIIMTKVQGIIVKLLKTAGTDIFQEIIDNIFKTLKPDTGIFTTDRPAIILNSIPFVINKVEEYPKIVFNHKRIP